MKKYFSTIASFIVAFSLFNCLLIVPAEAKSGKFVAIQSSTTTNLSDPHQQHFSGLESAKTSLQTYGGYTGIVVYRNYYSVSSILSYMDSADNLYFHRGHGTIMSTALYTGLELNASGSVVLSSQDLALTGRNLSNLRVAAFICCYTGYGGVNGTNLPSAAVSLGATTALGFKNEIDCATATDWTEDFGDRLARGNSVGSTCSLLAGNATYKAGKLNSYTICGSSNTTIA